MDLGAPPPIAPGAPAQLPALAAALAGGLLAALALWAGAALWRRRTGAGDRPVDPKAPPAAPADATLLLAGTLMVLVLALPAAAVVRQLWPHPALGWRLLARWLLVTVPPALAWLGLAAAIRNRRREP